MLLSAVKLAVNCSWLTQREWSLPLIVSIETYSAVRLNYPKFLFTTTVQVFVFKFKTTFYFIFYIKMSSPESDSKAEAEDEDDLLYLMIYDMKTYEKELKETVESPQSGRERPRPEPLIIDAESDDSEDETTQAQRQKDQEVDNTERPDMDTLDSIQRTPVRKAKARAKRKARAKAKDKKPWRKSGADITDYFNYGFDEESWDAYCKRQLQSRATNTKLWINIMAQRGHTSHEEKKTCSAPPFSGSQPTLASRESSPTTDFIGGQSSSRKKQRQCLNVEGNNTQEDTKMSPEEDPITFNDLPAPSNVNMKKFLPPRSYPYRKGPPPPSPLGALYRLDKGSDDLSTSVSPCSSGVSSVIPGNMTSRVGWIEAAMAWERFIRQEMCEQDCDRFRQHCLGKDSKRGSDRDRERTSSSHSSKEERTRHRETAERDHNRHRFSGEKEGRRRERRHGDTGEGCQKSSCSSSSGRSSSISGMSRRGSGEGRDSQSRLKHKKAKRNRKDTEMFRDQERKLKSD